jgi:transcriptional regulator with XRE-family HTH domain
MENKTFGQKLKAYRMKRHWTLRQMSAITGVRIATLSKIERGDTQPFDLTQAKIKDALPGWEEITEGAS